MAGRTLWGIHMSEIDQREPIERSFIAIGWDEMGDLSHLSVTRDAYKAAFAATYPADKEIARQVKAGVLFRFVTVMQTGDLVLYPSKDDRQVNLGEIIGGYEYRSERPVYCHLRKVRWVRHLPRTNFAQSALHEIGSAVTLFQVSNHVEEFLAAYDGTEPAPQDVDDGLTGAVAEQVEETIEDFIVRRLKTRQKPYEFEHFIAHLLGCMGYHARVTQVSGDGGVDVIAHRDELGFEGPVIKAQVKQMLDTIGRPAVQQLHGAIESGEFGLFITLGSYSAEARAFERTKPNLRLLDGPGLIELIYAHYQRFEPRYQRLLPLKRVYIPQDGSEADGS